MTKDEALHKALKVLNCLNNDRVYETAWVKGVINACEEALAHPTQEPVAYFKKWEDKSGEHKDIKFSNSEGYKPLYTQPAPRPTQEPVAWMHCVDEDITEFNDFQACPKCEPLYTHPKEWQAAQADQSERVKEALEPQIELADTISVEDYQKLREQPTKEEILGKVFDAVYAQYQPKAETQEPVLYIDGGGLDGHATWAQATRCQDTDIALYTHPKEWQGLSDAELEELSSEEELMFWGFARAIEAKLKEKNG